MQLPSFLTLENFEKAIGTLKSRFPIPSILAIILTGYIWYRVYLSDVYIQGEETMIFTIVTSLILTFFLSLGLTIWIEQQAGKRSSLFFKVIQILPLIYGGLYYWSFAYRESFDVQSGTFFALHMAGFVACIFLTPFLVRALWGDKQSIRYSNYFSKVSWTILMSMITGVALFILGSIALWAIYTLFDFSNYTHYDKLYGYWAAFSIALMAPLYGLSHFPVANKVEEKTYETNMFFTFLVKYVMVPFVFIYFVILYAYSVKVLANFSDWPKWIVSWLVIGFSTLGYITYIYSKPQSESVRYIGIFRRYFPYFVLPQVVMLAYAIYLRINQYSITMNRYFVVAFGLWLTIISLYYIFSRAKNLITIPLSLTLISLIISIGPWSVFSVSYNCQYTRLITNLTEANILQDGKIVPLANVDDIPHELSNEVAAGIEYLCDFDNCAGIKELFPEQTAKIAEKSEKDWKSWNTQTGAVYSGVSRWEISPGIKEAIKVQRYYGKAYGTEEEPYFYYNVMSKTYPYPTPLDIRGYTKLVTVYGIDQWSPAPDYQGDRVRIDVTGRILTYETSSGNTIIPFVLPDSFFDGTHARETNQSDMTFDVTGSGITLKLYIQNIAVLNPAYTGKVDYLPGVSGFALVK